MKFRWQNYKAFSNTGWIEIKPLTIFIGANASGKTSILQPLLLLKQTLQDAAEEVSLMPKGENVDAGSYEDMVYVHDVNKKIIFDIDLERRPKDVNKEQDIGSIPPSHIILKYFIDDNQMPSLNNYIVKDAFERLMLERKRLKSGRFNIKFCKSLDQEIDKDILSFIKKQQPQHFIFNSSELFKKQVEKKRKEKDYDIDKIEFSAPISLYVSILTFVEIELQKLLLSIKHIGPVREYPKRVYEFRGEYHDEVGPKGQYTFSLLYQMKNDVDKLKQLAIWLKHCHLAEEVECIRLPDRPLLMEIKVIPLKSNIKVNISDTYFGFSQILPLLVQSIMAKKNDIIITEQPEIHLNPACQTTLADFFVKMTKQTNAKFIVETHSEHLLLRLRTHIKRGELKPKDVSLYYTEIINGKSKVRRIQIDENGNFPNKDWPKGFFEQSLTENLMFVTSKKGNV